MLKWIALLLFSANCYGSDWEYVIIQETKTSSVDKEFYVVKFSTEWCGPCRSYVSTGKLNKLKSSLAVVEVDTDKETKWKVRQGLLPKVDRVPTFWLVRYKDKTKVVKHWEGTVDPEVILSETLKHKNTK